MLSNKLKSYLRLNVSSCEENPRGETTLSHALTEFIFKSVIVLALCFCVFDLVTFSLTTGNNQEEYERVKFGIVLQALEDPISQGSFVETSVRVRKLEKEGVFYCLKLRAWNFEEDTCEGSDTSSRRYYSLMREILNGQGSVRIYFDRSKIFPIILSRFIKMVLFLIILSLVCFYALNRIASRILLDLSEAVSREPVPKKIRSIRISEFRKIGEELAEKSKMESRLSSEEAAMSVTRQVAHDIRSPLAALQLVCRDLPGLPDVSRNLILGATQRISDIANNLLAKGNVRDSENTEIEVRTNILVASEVEAIVAQHRVLTNERGLVKIEFNPRPAMNGFVSVVRPQFFRVISNLITNAVEAIEGYGCVNVTVVQTVNEVQVVVADNGKGIPVEVLNNVGKMGYSVGKSNGNGLGLHHAFQNVEKWNGRIEINSTVGVGTEISVVIPRQSAPTWFSSLHSSDHDFTNKHIVATDDDPSILAVWKSVIVPKNGFCEKVSYFHFPDRFRDWIKMNKHDLENCFFLFDFELFGFVETGLDLVLEFGLEGRSILVTNHYENVSLQDRCVSSGVKIFPKMLIPFLDRIEPVSA